MTTEKIDLRKELTIVATKGMISLDKEGRLINRVLLRLKPSITVKLIEDCRAKILKEQESPNQKYQISAPSIIRDEIIQVANKAMISLDKEGKLIFHILQRLKALFTIKLIEDCRSELLSEDSQKEKTAPSPVLPSSPTASSKSTAKPVFPNKPQP